MALAQASPPAARLAVTQRALVPVCVDHSPVTAGQRRWSLGATPFAITFTMKNTPRPGRDNPRPGFATVTFTPEHGHRYEVEVRAAPATFASRVWPAGAWTPVVRDRTTDRIVSGDAVWTTGGCNAGGASAER